MSGPTRVARLNGSAGHQSMLHARLLLVLAFLTPTHLPALGLGDLTVSSHLDEPLVAEIRLLAVNPAELQTLQTRIAPPAEFAWEGIERTAFIARLETRADLNAAGEPVLRITSSEPLVEPKLDLLVEVENGGGRLLREVNIVLGPARPVSKRSQFERPDIGYRGSVQRLPATPVDENPEPARSLASKTYKIGGIAAPLPGEHYVTRPGDTLSGIVSRYRPGSRAAAERLTREIFDSNPDAFISGNIDLLMADTVLTIPGANGSGVEDIPGFPHPAGIEAPVVHAAPPAIAPAVPVAEVHSVVGEAVSGADPAIEGRVTATTGDPPVESPPPDTMIGVNHEVSPDARLAIMSGEGEKVEAGAYTIASSQYVANLEQTVTLARELAESRGRQVETLQTQQDRTNRVIDKQQRLIDLQAAKIADLRENLARSLATEERPFGTLMAVTVLLAVTLLVLVAAGVFLLRSANRKGTHEPANPDVAGHALTDAA